MSYLEIILMLVREDYVSVSHFLETVVRNMNGGDARLLKWLAREIDFRKFGTRALGTAAYRNNFEAVDTLLDRYVDINGSISGPHPHPSCRCQTSVIAYAQRSQLNREERGASDKMIAYLISRGAAKLTGVDMDLLGLLGCALRQHKIKGHVFFSKIQAIVERIDDFADTACKTESFLEACIQESEQDSSCIESRLQVFEYLLDQGAKTSSGSPLAALIHNHGPQRLVEKLLVNTENINAYYNSVTYNDILWRMNMMPLTLVHSLNPLQAAALHGNKKMTQLLLNEGADVNCPARGSGGVTPLQAICCLEATLPEEQKMKEDIAMFLVTKKANVNAAPAWHAGFTALQWAAIAGDEQVADILLARGADVNSPPCKYGGGTALVMAARQEHVGMVRILVKSGAKIPAAGVQVPAPSVAYNDTKVVTDFILRTSDSDPGLMKMACANGFTSRDYHEYEAEWSADPTYESKG